MAHCLRQSMGEVASQRKDFSPQKYFFGIFKSKMRFSSSQRNGETSKLGLLGSLDDHFLIGPHFRVLSFLSDNFCPELHFSHFGSTLDFTTLE